MTHPFMALMASNAPVRGARTGCAGSPPIAATRDQRAV